MATNENKILETITLANGLEIDIDEGYRKLISSQFGGDQGRGFGELIQNFIDSYPSDVPIEDRKGEIETGIDWISLTDYGEGLNMDKIKLLLTLGGTDKDKDPSKIGMFGIGFFSIFNPRLGTKQVKVTTICEGQPVEILFIVENPDKRPQIKTRVLSDEITFSTKIEVRFKKFSSVQKCLNHAEKALLYYPCQVSINGTLFRSVWVKAKEKGNVIHVDGALSGFLEYNNYQEDVTMLCKYEFITMGYIYGFSKGGHNIKHDLRDYKHKQTPFLPRYSATINNNLLSVTISRDGYYLNYHFDRSVDFLNKMLLQKLVTELPYSMTPDTLIANLYIFSMDVKSYLIDPEKHIKENPEMAKIIVKLAEAKIFKISDGFGLLSITDLKSRLSEGLPLFFSEEKMNLRWLGGAFKHDFIVLPVECMAFHRTPGLYEDMFNTIFSDTVNLDTIQNNNRKIMELVERKIVDKSALTPNCSFVGEKKLSKGQMKLLLEINSILENKEVIDAISENIKIPIANIRATFFDVKEEGAYISTGLFTEHGTPLSEDFVSNFESKENMDKSTGFIDKRDVLLGLRLDHPFIQYLVDSDNEHKAYFTLTYIAHELALCQKLLVPYSPFYHFVKEKTAAGMRKALINQMLQF
jgi:hypothetical protein